MLVRYLGANEGVAFRCPCRTHTFGRRELINAFGADTPLENIGLRYRCGRCDLPAHDAWITSPEVVRDQAPE
jgi:hypothetical protein